MRIEEIEEILGLTRLPAPMHILLTDEPLTDGLYLGLQPKDIPDVIVIGAGATPETVFHEIVHTLGFGEEVAYPAGRLLKWIWERRRKREYLSKLLRREVKYELCQGCERFRTLHDKYSGRIQHYILRR
jgi:hypothetical protein